MVVNGALGLERRFHISASLIDADPLATCINVTTSLSHVNNRAGHNFKMPSSQYGSGSDLPFKAETYGLDQVEEICFFSKSK